MNNGSLKSLTIIFQSHGIYIKAYVLVLELSSVWRCVVRIVSRLEREEQGSTGCAHREERTCKA